jgi:outer membrane biosynthesis protein TonB
MQTKFLHRAFCVLSCAALAAGCGKKQIRTVADGPPLSMPAPPSRVFAPIEDEEPLASAAVPVPPETSSPRATQPTRPTPRRQTTEPERPEQAPPAPAVAPAPEPPRELRPASSPGDQESERKIGELMRRAQQTLNNVDYRVLSTGRRENYDSAKAMITEAEKALKERNYLLAETLADKAVKLATDLLGR